MGFFYRGTSNTERYVSKIDQINQFGVPKQFVTEIELMWGISLRLANYNPADANRILDECTHKEIYEAYVIYASDKFGDDG